MTTLASKAEVNMLARHRPEQTPFVGHAFENVTAAPFERQSGTCHEIAHRLRNQNFTRGSERRHARANMHGNADNIVSAEFAFAGMQTATDLEIERAHRIADRAGATHGARRP